MRDCYGEGLKDIIQPFSSFCSLECVLMSYKKKLSSTEGAFENLLQPLHFKPAAFSAHLLLFKAKLF